MRLGALLAGKKIDKDRDLFQAIDEFGLNLGRAFQIIDDVLDVTSDFSGLKEKGNDIQEGKRSLLFIRLQQKLAGSELEFFKNVMNKPIGEKSRDEIDIIIGMMESHDVIQESKQEAQHFADNCKDILLTKLPFSFDIKKFYGELIDFLVQRSY